MAIFRMQVKDDKTGLSWWEEYERDIPIDRCQAEAEGIMRVWNDGLRPHENPRTLLKVDAVSDVFNGHRWEKSTGGMSVPFRGQHVDLYYCERCRITGKKFGLQSSVRIDSKFRGDKFKTCSPETALEVTKILYRSKK